MSLIRFDEVSLEFGEQVLLREASMSIEPGERVCLIGRNGAGKTSLLKLITGELEPDHGVVQLSAGLGISQLTQNLPGGLERTVREVVTGGLEGSARTRQSVSPAVRAGTRRNRLARTRSAAAADRCARRLAHRTARGHSDHRTRSAGRQAAGATVRRLATPRRAGRAIVSQPDLLLLDEPTNHLDLATISWLEDRIYSWPGAVLFITHDRAFLQRMATRILELDLTRLSSWDCDYHTYLRRKETALEAEQSEQNLFDKKLAEEEVWIRQGIKARRTRNEGRVRALEAMRREAGGAPQA